VLNAELRTWAQSGLSLFGIPAFGTPAHTRVDAMHTSFNHSRPMPGKPRSRSCAKNLMSSDRLPHRKRETAVNIRIYEAT